MVQQKNNSAKNVRVSIEQTSRLILCRNCTQWTQAPNPEMGTCCCDGLNNITNYDTRCLLGLYENVSIPDALEFATITSRSAIS